MSSSKQHIMVLNVKQVAHQMSNQVDYATKVTVGLSLTLLIHSVLGDVADSMPLATLITEITDELEDNSNNK